MWNEWTNKLQKLNMQEWTRKTIIKVYFDRWVFRFCGCCCCCCHQHFSFFKQYRFPPTSNSRCKHTHTICYWEYNAWINITAIWLRFLSNHSVFPFLPSFLAARLQQNQPLFFYRFSFNKCAKFNAIRFSIFLYFILPRVCNTGLKIKPMTVDVMTEDIKKKEVRRQKEREKRMKMRDRMSSTTKIEHTNQHVILLNRMEIYGIHIFLLRVELKIKKKKGKNNTQPSLHTKCSRCMCRMEEWEIKAKLMKKKRRKNKSKTKAKHKNRSNQANQETRNNNNAYFSLVYLVEGIYCCCCFCCNYCW